MSKSVFISYRHSDGEWVLGRLKPCLEAGGADVRVDVERFKAGKALVGQMDAEQDAADINVLVLSEQYFQSDYCVHEFKRALQRDPKFAHGLIVPVLRSDVDWRKHITVKDPPLLVDLREDGRPRLSRERQQNLVRQWDRLLEACAADLGCDAPEWLRARDETRRYLERHQSVNLLVSGDPAWHSLIDDLHENYITDLGIVDLLRPAANSRRGLVAEILKAVGSPVAVPPEPEDLVVLDHELSSRPLTRLALQHFDLVTRPQYFHPDLLNALRYLVMESRKLVLLAQTRRPFAALLPDQPISKITIQMVELRGR